MKYFETKQPYYALIPAKSKEEAKKMYVEEICDDDDNCLEKEMKEITQIEAFVKFASAVEEDGYGESIETIGRAIDEFYNAHILLIDGCLR